MASRSEAVPNGTVHLDTVRALHRTVVSLRTALEVSKNELKELKEKYEQHSNCVEYADVIEKLTLENHILRRKIIDSGCEERDLNGQNIKLEVTYSPRSQNIDSSEIIIKTATDEASSIDDLYLKSKEKSKGFGSLEDLNETGVSHSPELNVSADFTPLNTHNSEAEEISQVTSISKQENEEIHQPSYQTKLELLSKFDVKIKVRTLKEGTVASSLASTSTEETDSTEGKEKETTETKDNFYFQKRKEGKPVENRENFSRKINKKSVSTDNIKMAVPNEADVKSKTDKYDVKVRITSEENLIVKENIERSRRKDTLNLDVDDLSLRSLSEGDNSVFSESGTTPIDPNATAGTDEKQEYEASGNESEEVDDIELIFTTDESKDMSNLQEDLVSIRETDQWTPHSASTTHSTPVLIKFHTLDPDFQPGGETTDNAENQSQENSCFQSIITESSLKIKRVSLPNDTEIKHVAFNSKDSLDLPGRGILKSCDNKSDNMLYRKSPNTSNRRLDSVDSLTCEYNRGLSFDNTKSSSFELGSSMDILHRDESMDSFHKTGHLGHRFSVFAERDISKCGTSEDDLAVNLNLRRNTCPNPFQYRLPPYRGVSRPPGPFKAPVTSSRLRPVLRESSLTRRENAAQTDVSALPPRWSSDGYLAHKMSMPPSSGAPTLPQRTTYVASRRLSVRDAKPPPPQRRSDETRRVMLSDIGFTSMVPELSRSADPVWALSKKQAQSDDSITNSASKFLSRGASYRSPCPSIDRSNDWTPNHLYVSTSKELRPWRRSLPDVRRDDTDELLEEAETYLRRSIDNLHSTSLDLEKSSGQSVQSVQAVQSGQPYLPSEPRQLRLGHAVKVITPHGRIAVGRVRYVGLAGNSAAVSSVVVGAEFSLQQNPTLPRNDGTHRGRRYFLTPPHYTALFVPFSKVVMAWAN